MPLMPLVESDYLPFLVGDVPPGPWLVLAPHPDDETYGMGGSIRRAADLGIDVRVIVLTDGALGGPNTHDLVSIRRGEAQNAANILGVNGIDFWNEPDRQLRPTQGTVRRLANDVKRQRPRTLFFPSITEPHPDHRAAALIGWEALRVTQFRATPVGYEISSQGPINLLLDVTDTIAAKSRAMDIYASQEAERPYCKRVIAQNIARTWSMPDKVEYAESFLVLDPSDTPLADVVKPLFSRYTRGLTIDDSAPRVELDASSVDSNREAANRVLAEELRAIKMSRSWRWTEPYRKLGHLLRRRPSRRPDADSHAKGSRDGKQKAPKPHDI